MAESVFPRNALPAVILPSYIGNLRYTRTTDVRQQSPSSIDHSSTNGSSSEARDSNSNITYAQLDISDIFSKDFKNRSIRELQKHPNNLCHVLSGRCMDSGMVQYTTIRIEVHSLCVKVY